MDSHPETQPNSVEDKMDESQVDEVEKEENVTNDGGVKKKIIRKGDGWRTPEKGFEAKVHYVGKLLDGTQFDSSRDRNEPFIFKLGAGKVIRGWEEGVQSMKKGEIALFTLQPEYGYGEAGSPPKIPANATLQFEIELIEWIEEKDVSELKDNSVLKRTIVEGEGWEKPKDDCKVKITYTGRLESTPDKIFEQKSDFEFTIGAEEVIRGIEEAVMNMKKGEKALFTIKPDHAYGAQGNESLGIPPNTTLKYEIELIEFEKQKERWDMTKEEKIETATKRKNEGNELFALNKIARALKKYKAALDLFEFDSDMKGEDREKANKVKLPCYLNVAACKLKLSDWESVKENCSKALEIDPQNTKALFRRGVARTETDEWELARRDFQLATDLDPKNVELKKEFQRLKTKMAEQDKRDKAMFARMFAENNTNSKVSQH